MGRKQKPWRSKWLGRNRTTVMKGSVSYSLDLDTSYFKMPGWPERDCGYQCRAIWLSSAVVVPRGCSTEMQPSFASWGTWCSARGMDPRKWCCRSQVWAGTSIRRSVEMPAAQIRISLRITAPQLVGQWRHDLFFCWLSKGQYKLLAFQTWFSSNIGASLLQIDSPTSREHRPTSHPCWGTCHGPTQTLGIYQFSDGHCYLLQGSATARRPLCKGIFLPQGTSQNTSKAKRSPWP